MRSSFSDILAAFAKICSFLEAEGFTNQGEKPLQELRLKQAGRIIQARCRLASEKTKQFMSIKLRIISAMKRLAEEQPIAQPLDNDPCHQTANVDSRAFALLVAHLEDDPAIDAFSAGEPAFPFTADDFVGTNENASA